jgi:hypothetical protein
LGTGTTVDILKQVGTADWDRETPDRANIPVICKRKRRRYRGQRAGCQVRTRKRRVGKLSILLANVQSLDNKLNEVENIVINCRPHYLPREFSAILLVAVYLPPQTDAGTKTALSQLYKEISKQENTHPEEALLVARDFNAGKLKSILPNFHQHSLLGIGGRNFTFG